MKAISVLGSTGSIGTQTLQIAEEFPEQFRVVALTAGRNLKLFGSREPDVDGSVDLASINARVAEAAAVSGRSLDSFQSNSEAELIEKVHAAKTEQTQAIIINPAGLTHTSVSLRDAIAGVAIPFVEVHLSNVYAREPFRHHSFFSDLAVGVISGFGSAGYDYALQFLLNRNH